jgi:hypothetical protein
MTQKTIEKLVLSVILLSLFSVPVYFFWPRDGSAEYALFIDAGSSGSRIHLYKWQQDDDAPIPLIEEIALGKDCRKTGPGLAKQKSSDVGKSLERLTNCARSELDDRVENLNKIPLYLLATAGMRLLKRDDEPLHEEKMEQVRAYLQSAPFDLRDASTIDAKEEAIYAWVTANYLNRNLTTKTGNGTIGILELGGASGQIAFVPQNQMPEDTNVVHIAGNKYRVYARGYDGVGKTEITKAFENEKSCFPRNYEGSGEGDYDTCQKRIIEFLKTTDRSALRRLREETPPDYDGNFLAISNYYHTPSFFGQENVLDYGKLEGAGSKYCTEDWEKIAADNPDVPPKFLSGHCLMSAYIPALLSAGFRVEDDDGRVKLRLGGSEADVDWTLGALILLLH